MTVRRWGGRWTRDLTAVVLYHKGTTCHLCGLPGADSIDHDPPRSVLIARGVLDPDAMGYLFPSHWRPCNNRRRDHDITDALRAECRRLRLASLGLVDDVVPNLSARFARRRAEFFESSSNSVEGDRKSVV